MATITDYNSLSNAITDFAHRSDIVGSSVYTDYFIQGAIDKIQNDVFDLNFGNGVQWMENAYPPTAISSGTVPVPSDWLAPKVFTINDGSSDSFTLIWKAAAWIYNNYPVRQPTGLPAYIARDVQVGGGSFPATTAYQTFTATANQTVFTLTNSSAVLFVTLDGAMLVPGTDYTISTLTLTLTNGALAGQVLYVQYAALAASLVGSSTSSFIFGPYPDSAYTVQGTYYQKAPMLSGSQTTNWMVLNAPWTLHAACMIKCGEFLLDDQMIGRWTGLYQPRLQALVDRDKAERWGASTMQVEVA